MTKPTDAMRAEPSLECDHCGDVAIYGDKKGMFTDGAGGPAQDLTNAFLSSDPSVWNTALELLLVAIAAWRAETRKEKP